MSRRGEVDMPVEPPGTRAGRLRAWVQEGRDIARAQFGLTSREREGVLLVLALFVFGLAVKWLRLAAG